MLAHKLKTCSAGERDGLRERLFSAKVAWRESLAVLASKRVLDQGHVFAKSKRLHKLERLSRPGSHAVSGDEDIVNMLVEKYDSTFEARNLQLRSAISDFCWASEGASVDFDELEVEAALEVLKKPRNLDRYGVCVDLFKASLRAQPDAFVNLLNRIVASSLHMRSLVVDMRVFRKKSGFSQLDDVRGILPPCALLKLVDRLLSVRLKNMLSTIFPKVPGLYFGSQRFTQCRDLTHASNLLMDKNS